MRATILYNYHQRLGELPQEAQSYITEFQLKKIYLRITEEIILPVQIKTVQTTASFTNGLNKASILNERLNIMSFSTTNGLLCI